MIFLKWLASALTLILVAYLLPGVTVSSFYIALITALILGLINTVIRPVLILLTLPINIVTLGLFTFVLNAVLFWFVATFVDGFDVAGFGAAFWGALCMTLITWIIYGILED